MMRLGRRCSCLLLLLAACASAAIRESHPTTIVHVIADDFGYGEWCDFFGVSEAALLSNLRYLSACLVGLSGLVYGLVVSYIVLLMSFSRS
jgi:hypothetical protein